MLLFRELLQGRRLSGRTMLTDHGLRNLVVWKWHPVNSLINGPTGPYWGRLSRKSYRCVPRAPAARVARHVSWA